MNSDNLSYLTVLSQLAAACRILPEFRDNDGVTQVATPSTKRLLLTAMGYQCDTEVEARESLAALRRKELRRPVQPVIAFDSQKELRFELCLPADTEHNGCLWSVQTEDGDSVDGSCSLEEMKLLGTETLGRESFSIYEVQTTRRLPLGYHRLSVKLTRANGARHDLEETCRLIVHPSTCYTPACLAANGQIVTLNLQLNSLRSGTNFGTGNLGDVIEIARQVGPRGVGALGLSPLHPPQPDGSGSFSPYLPVYRCATDFVRIDIRKAAERLHADTVITSLEQGPLARRLHERREMELVDAQVGDDIFVLLEEMHKHFERTRNASNHEAGKDFDRFVKKRGRRLELYATYAAIRRKLMVDDSANADWRNWPEEYRNPNSPQVVHFQTQHRAQIELFLFIEWLARKDVDRLHQNCKNIGMPIGPYVDVALSAAAGGAEIWMDPTLVVLGATIGFPPDALGPQGQNIGSPPVNPMRLREAEYEPWIELIRYTMEGAGAIRLDHFPQIERLLWIPVGLTPAEGAYVQSYRDELLAVLCLESHRHQCLVVGEDLGTVPEVVRTAMQERQILSYLVVRFERKWGEDRTHIRPADYRRNAMAVITTHDLALLRALWSGSDIDLRDRLKLDAPGVTDGFRKERLFEKKILLDLLEQTGLITPTEREMYAAAAELPQQLLVDIHRLMKLTPCKLIGIELGDATELEVPYNVPGTSENDRPANWRVKQPFNSDAILSRGSLLPILTALCS